MPAEKILVVDDEQSMTQFLAIVLRKEGYQVTGAADGSVAWSVQEGSTGGSITSAGVYTAPASAGTYHVVATSQAAPGSSATVPVTVADRILGVAVSPSTVSLAPGATAQFTATVTTTCGSYTSTQTVTAPN